jgi:hypothetical protein
LDQPDDAATQRKGKLVASTPLAPFSVWKTSMMLENEDEPVRNMGSRRARGPTTSTPDEADRGDEAGQKT